ncbi:MAG: TonB-dependent receptor plug domain-containing protein [Bacteroidales bacterium]|nr:TonB-dependent receptor plug domain-containing protein [Bacteroidales bacterium]
MKIFIHIGILCFCFGLTRGQSLNDTITLSEVEVKTSAHIVPPGIVNTSIDTMFIIENQFNCITEILHNYTPVFVKSYGNGGLATVSFRGTHASHTKVQWNGMDINSPMLGQVDFSNIPVFFFDDMELYHGNSSLLNGSGGLGGSIALGTHPDWDNKFDISLINQAGSFGTFNTGMKVGFGNNRIQIKSRIFYGKSNNDFTYFNTSIPGGGWEKNKNAAFQSIHLMQEAYYRINSSQQLSLAVWCGVNIREVPPLMNYGGVYRKEELNNKDIKATAGWSFLDKTGAQWSIHSGYNSNQLTYFLGDSVDNLIRTDNFDTISNSRSDMQSIQNNLDWEKNLGILGEWHVSVYHQFEQANTHDDAPQSRNGYDAQRNKLGIMVNVDKTFTSGFSGFLILRQELVDDSFLPPSALLGLQISANTSWNPMMKVSVASNNNIPSLNALYWVPWGNEDLKTEEGYSGDLGFAISKQSKNLQFQSSINLFGSYMYDWIMWVPGKSAQNVQEVFARGAEASLRTNIHVFDVNFTFSGNYSFTRTTSEKRSGINDNSEGKQLIYIPLHKVGTYAKCDYRKFYIKQTFSFTDKRYSSLDNDLLNTMPEYYLHDIVIGKEIEKERIGLDFNIGVQNIFDQAYQSVLYRAMPGRHYKLSLVVNIKK